MAWVNVPGLPGRVYLPQDADPEHKKHPCKTCFSCQWCDENRCQVCRVDQRTEAVEPGSCCRRRPATTTKTSPP
jgi:hypothetical protein